LTEAIGGMPGKLVGNGKRPRIGYLVNGDDDNVLPAHCGWLSAGLRVNVFSEPTRVNGVSFPRGSLLLRVADNPESLHDAIAAAVKTHGVTVHAVDSAFVDEGAGFGGPNVHWAKPPRVLLVVDRPTDYTVGHTWFLFDQVWHYPITRVAGRTLPEVDWSKFDVCILPHGNYSGEPAPSGDTLRRMKDWVHGGGTLVLVGGASKWATGDKVKLLAAKLETRKMDDDKPTVDKKDEKADEDKKPPLEVPGVFMRMKIDDDHFVTWGADKEAVLYFSGNRIFTPMKALTGKNLVTFADAKGLVASGYCWPETLPLLPGRSSVLYQSSGRGHVVAFADDPNYRAFSPPLQRFFFNAVFFGHAR